MGVYSLYFFFFFNDTATTEIYTLSLHDALPISREPGTAAGSRPATRAVRLRGAGGRAPGADRKSTRLNSSHDQISYAVFCLKKKKIRHALGGRLSIRHNQSYSIAWTHVRLNVVC